MPDHQLIADGAVAVFRPDKQTDKNGGDYAHIHHMGKKRLVYGCCEIVFLRLQI